MCSNYFDKLLLQAQELDAGIERLTETWKLPHVLMGRLGECTVETNAHINAVWNVILNTQNGIEEVLSNTKENDVEASLPVEQFIQKCKEEYEDLKEQCNALETVLAEYGYRYSKGNDLNEMNASNGDNTNCNSGKEVKNVAVEFTPNHNGKCKLISNTSTPRVNDNYLSHIFLTPIINKSSLREEDNSVPDGESVGTSMTKRPEEPIYSKHFYTILKE